MLDKQRNTGTFMTNATIPLDGSPSHLFRNLIFSTKCSFIPSYFTAMLSQKGPLPSKWGPKHIIIDYLQGVFNAPLTNGLMNSIGALDREGSLEVSFQLSKILQRCMIIGASKVPHCI